MFGRSLRKMTGLASLVLAAGAAVAAASTYTDTTGDNNGGGVDEDIVGATITNDATNLTFTILLNPSANLTSSDAGYEHIEFALQTGPGGYTALSNPYGEAIGISSGWNYYALGYIYNSTPGANLYSGTTAGTTQITSAFGVSDVATGTPSFTLTIPLATLGLSAGQSFYFDAYTSYGGGQGAYDALDNPTYTAGTPYSGTYFTAYDSNPSGTVAGTQQQTNSLFGTAAYQYTVTGAPEPTAAGLLGIAALCGWGRRRRR